MCSDQKSGISTESPSLLQPKGQDKKVREERVRISEVVQKGKFGEQWEGPFKIKEALGKGTY